MAAMTATHPLDIGLDLDGVGYDFLGSLRQFLVSSTGRHASELPDAVRWEFYEDWGLTLQEFLAHCHAGVDAGVVFSYGPPIHRYAQLVARLRTAGHRVHLVTDRAFGAAGASQAATRHWLARHNIVVDTLTFSADKTCVPTQVFIEDKLSNYDALAAAGVHAVLLNRPYNQVPDDGRRRVDTLEQFADLVDAIAAQPDATRAA